MTTDTSSNSDKHAQMIAAYKDQYVDQAHLGSTGVRLLQRIGAVASVSVAAIGLGLVVVGSIMSGAAPAAAVGYSIAGMFTFLSAPAVAVGFGLSETALRYRVANAQMERDLANGTLEERYKTEVLPRVLKGMEDTRDAQVSSASALSQKIAALRQAFGLAVADQNPEVPVAPMLAAPSAHVTPRKP